MNGGIPNTYDPANTRQYDMRLETQQPRLTGLSSQMRSLNETGESGTYNNTYSQNNTTVAHGANRPIEDLHRI